MKTIIAAALLALCGTAAIAEPAKVDGSKLAPVVGVTWVTGSCAVPEQIVDWVIDTDGEVYRRDGGFTPMTHVSLSKGEFVTHDETGIGLTRSVYRLAEGGLRLWDEVWYEDGSLDGAPSVVVKGGRTLEGDDASAEPATPTYSSCPLRTMVSSEALAALNGKWAAMPGGSCSEGTGAIAFDLDRPVPRISRGPMGDRADGEAYVLAIAREGDAWTVTEGSSFEASVYRFTLGKDGTLTQHGDDEGAAPVRFHRCM